MSALRVLTVWPDLAALGYAEILAGTVLGTFGYFENTQRISQKSSDANKPFSDAGLEVVPGDGIEPPTRGFSVRCSTD